MSWFSWGKPAAKAPVVEAPAAPPPPPPQPALSAIPPKNDAERSPFSPRSLRQLGLFFVGAGFLLWSTRVTRRSISRKLVEDSPKFWQAQQPGAQLRASAAAASPAAAASASSATAAAAVSSAKEAAKREGSLVAVEALGLATLNVIAFGIMMTGGLSWAFDVSSVEDLRAMARRKLVGAGGGEGQTDEEAEKAVEEWVAKVLSRAKKEKGEGSSGGAAGNSENRKGE